ncbi:MAG: NAD+ synthase [Cyanobium sp.]
MRIALAQLNPLIGDLEGNAERILQACVVAAAAGADLVLTPELSLWGYPPRDLLLRDPGMQRQQRVLDGLQQALPIGLQLLVGMADPVPGETTPRLWNALALLRGGEAPWSVVAHKRLLPSYDVFDESRYFLPGQRPALLEWGQRPDGRPWRLGLSICEDLWVEQDLQTLRVAGVDPIGELAAQGLDLLLNLSASPYGRGKLALRRQLAQRAASRAGCPLVYVNQVGGNDELVFDGDSFVVEAGGTVLGQGPCCREALLLWDAADPPGSWRELPLAAGRGASDAGMRSGTTSEPAQMEQLLRALVLGVRDYARKCGFQGALLGLSGGIDSALVAVVAAAALGADRVKALRLPSPWSSRGSLDDAQALAERLGLRLQTLPIQALMQSFDAALTPVLAQEPSGVTAENLQSRIRGTLLMAIANQSGALLLSTGNKSELAVGYCTLYGDMNGGLSVIGDLYKTTVFSLCDWIDSNAAAACRSELGLPATGELIGAAIRHKPPSAELRPDQRDSDTLPDYAVLDALLRRYIETVATPEQLIREGADPELVLRVFQLLRRAEFKRRQAAPVLKISSRSFGGGWRMPIAAG